MPSFTSADPNAYVALGMQTALGSPALTAAKVRTMRYSGANQFAITPQVVDIREGGDGMEFGFSYKQRIDAAGTLRVNLRPETAGLPLAVIIGGATWDGGSAPGAHTFHTNHASIPYSTLHVAHPGTDLINMYSDVRFTGVTLTAQAGQPLQLEMPWRAMTVGATIGIPALVATNYGEDPFLYHYSPSYQVDGAADSTIESWTIAMAYGTEDLQAQSILLDDMVVHNRTIDLTVVRRYQNSTKWKQIAYGGGNAPTQSVPTGRFDAITQYGTGGALRSFEVHLGLVAWHNDAVTELNADGATIKETFTGRALKTASASMQMLLKNIHASAYIA